MNIAPTYAGQSRVNLIYAVTYRGSHREISRQENVTIIPSVGDKVTFEHDASIGASVEWTLFTIEEIVIKYSVNQNGSCIQNLICYLDNGNRSWGVYNDFVKNLQ